MQHPIWLSWSSGKDNAWTLYVLQKQGIAKVTGLFTSINETQNRATMHSTRYSILEAQAAAINLPLYTIPIPDPCDEASYNIRMHEFINATKAAGITQMAFGDLFLEWIRLYREKMLLEHKITAIFPLWKISTQQLAFEMIDNGLKAIITCVDTTKLSGSFVGREFDRELLLDLPQDVDPCGENGEFHTCVYDGPMFKIGLKLCRGETHQSEQFQFIDLILS